MPGQGFSNPPPPYPTQPNPNNYNQRSRNSSVATDYNNYDPQQKGRRHHEAEYRQGYQAYSPEDPSSFHDVSRPLSHESQHHQQHHHQPQQHPPQRQGMSRQQPPHHSQHSQQQQQPPRFQQPEMPYRMLKRNDEKSAEYIAIHGGGPIIQPPTGEEIKLKPRSPKVEATEKVSEAKGTVPPTPKENVWEKRMEEQKKAERVPKQNSRYQQELDYNFPSINDAPKDASEWNPPPTLAPVQSSDANYKKRNQRRNESGGGQYSQQARDPREQQQQRSRTTEALPIDADSIGATHWVQQQSGPSWDNLSIPTDHRSGEAFEEDDVYTGTKREFVNSKRARGGQFKSGEVSSRESGASRRGNPANGGGAINGKKPSTAPKATFDPAAKRHSRTEDTFSNMGEFSLDEFKANEEAVAAAAAAAAAQARKHQQQQQPHRPRDTFEGGDSFDGSRRGSKRGAPRQPRGNNNWKGSERPRNEGQQREFGGDEAPYERHHDPAARGGGGNGRRLAPMVKTNF